MRKWENTLIAIGFVGICTLIYVTLGFWGKFGMPYREIVWSLPLSILAGLLEAYVDFRKDNIQDFIGACIFCSTLQVGIMVLIHATRFTPQ